MCSVQIKVSTQVKNLLFGCGTDGNFGQATLSGAAEVTSTRGAFIFADQSCAPPPVSPTPTAAPTAAPRPCCPSCPSCTACNPCQGCPVGCNCGDTRGWQKSCGDKAVKKTVKNLRTIAVATTCIGDQCTKADAPNNGDRCPIVGCMKPSCSCALELRMMDETRDVVENVCEWFRVSVQGNFGARSHHSRIFDKPFFHVASRSAVRTGTSDSVSAAFVGVCSTLSAFLLISVIVNVVYLRKCYLLSRSIDTNFETVSRSSNESQ